MLLFSAVTMIALYVMQRVQHFSRGTRRNWVRYPSPRVQYGCLVHYQYKLAELLRRDHHELLHPDGRARLPQFRFRGRRDRIGHCFHTWNYAARKEHNGKFLGRHHPRHIVGSASAVRGVLARTRVARGSAEFSSLRQEQTNRAAKPAVSSPRRFKVRNEPASR